MNLFSELKLVPTNGPDNDWGFFVEIDVVHDSTPIQKEKYYKPRYYLLYNKQLQPYQYQYQRQRQRQILPSISEDNPLETNQKYEHIIIVKITFYVVISMFIFSMLSIHF